MPSQAAVTERPVVVVTGGARRIGAAVCRAMAQAGWDVVCTYNSSTARAKDLAAELRSTGHAAHAVQLTFQDAASLDSAAKACAAQLPRVDAIVHNASSYAPSPVGQITATKAAAHYTANALGPLLLTQAIVQKLRASATLPSGPNAGPSVVAMCDVAVMGQPRTNHAAYSMAKAALHEMVRCLARDLAPRVRVNGVALGVAGFPESGPEADPAFQERYLARVPMGRSGEPAEVAEAVRWLIEDAAYTTGEILRVDGGRWLG